MASLLYISVIRSKIMVFTIETNSNLGHRQIASIFFFLFQGPVSVGRAYLPEEWQNVVKPCSVRVEKLQATGELPGVPFSFILKLLLLKICSKSVFILMGDRNFPLCFL